MSRSWRWGLRSLGLGLLAWFLWRADWGQVALLARRADPGSLWPVPLLGAAMIGVRAWRWNLLLGLQNLQLPLGRAGLVYTAGVFLGMVTPGRLGDLGKALYLRREPGTPLEKVVAGTLADRLFDLGLMALLAVWALWHLELVSLRLAGWLVVLGLALGGGVVLILRGRGGWFAGRPFWRFARGLQEEMAGVLGWLGVWAGLLTLLAYGCYFLQTYLLARALGLALGAADVTAAIVLVGLASFLPISVAGLGTREGILVLVMAQRAVPNSVEMALAFSGIFFAVCFAMPALVGYLCWLKVPPSPAPQTGGQNRGTHIQPGPAPLENPS